MIRLHPSGSRWLLAALGVSGSALALQACGGSEFSTCSSTLTCEGGGSGGGGQSGSSAGSSGVSGNHSVPEGGAAGKPTGVGGETDAAGAAGAAGAETAGAGGEAPVPECVHDADCSDQLACNGSESCIQGACVPGIAPCSNPDPVHCDVVCKELNGAAACSVQGQDKDGDGHLSAACASTPGDDCDDGAAAIHPGAPELCDRVDNNCNGKIDLADGLPVSGTTVAIGPSGATRGMPAIAWATDKPVYGITYYDGTTSPDADLYFETIDQTGAVTLAPKTFNELLQTGGARTVALTWGGDRFGVGWTVADQSHTYMTTFTSAGVSGILQDIPEHGSYVDVAGVARVAGGTWAVLSSIAESSSLWGRTVSAAGIVSANETQVDTGQADLTSATIVATGTNFVTGYTAPNNAATVSVWSSLLTTPAPTKITGQRPALGAGPNGFAVAVTPAVAGNPPQFYAFGPSGAAVCGPVSLADKNFVPAAVVGTAKGYLVVSSGAVRVQEVLANCTMGALFTVDGGPAKNVGVAGSATGYGVVWQDVTAGVPKRRVFGPDFCN